ncbi:MAG: chemotaxis protein CheB [Proteobacteria bacterium]|nr:MAG: chemotaxis protein CheB [Pseudomonadota bacterium]
MSLKIITIGGSAGCIPSISEILKQLPVLPNVAICITVHIPAHSPSLLPQIFANATAMPVMHAQDGMEILAGRVYVAPPDFHLLIKGRSLELARGARENYHRPSIDPMFRSASQAFAANHIAVLLSGYLDDGSAGLIAVKRAGGTIVIQDPEDTMYPDMPRNALEYVAADCVCALSDISPFLIRQLAKPVDGFSKSDNDQVHEVNMVKISQGDSRDEMPGDSCGLVCPECSGPLWEIKEKDSAILRYRCHEGHAYSALSLEAGQNEALEAALWTALRAMDEKVELTERLAARAQRTGQSLAYLRYQKRHERTKAQAELIRKVLLEGISNSKD